MISTLTRNALLSLLLVFSAAPTADTLQIPLGQQGVSQSLPLPERGSSPETVLREYGEPRQRHAPVGQPPISRWDYADFSVYFEYQHVVRAVRHHQRRNP